MNAFYYYKLIGKKTAQAWIKNFKRVILGLMHRVDENIIFVIGIFIGGNVKEKIRQLPSNNEKCRDTSSE